MKKEEQIGFQLRAINNLMHRRREASPTHQYADRLTGTHGWIIGYLCDHQEEEIFQRDIEARFSMRRSTASCVLGLMEKNGLLRREPVARDARLKRLILTDQALAIHQKILVDIAQTEALLRTGISEEETAAFLATLQKMKANLETERTEESKHD